VTTTVKFHPSVVIHILSEEVLVDDVRPHRNIMQLRTDEFIVELPWTVRTAVEFVFIEEIVLPVLHETEMFVVHFGLLENVHEILVGEVE
jgi:hypothetical protein